MTSSPRQKWALPSIEIRVDRARRSRKRHLARRIPSALIVDEDQRARFGADSRSPSGDAAAPSRVRRRQIAPAVSGAELGLGQVDRPAAARCRHRSIAAVWALRRNVIRNSSRSLSASWPKVPAVPGVGGQAAIDQVRVVVIVELHHRPSRPTATAVSASLASEAIR